MQRVNLAVIPLVFLGLTFLVLSILNVEVSFSSPTLLLVLNACFITIANVVVAVICAQSYLKQRGLSLLLLGSGLLIGGLVSIIAGLGISYSTNFVVTVFNLGMLVFAGLQFLGALFSSSSAASYFSGRANLVIAYSLSLLFIAVLSVASWYGWLPIFYSATGATVIRQVVLGQAIVLFIMSSIVLLVRFHSHLSSSIFWYSLGLISFALGLIGVALAPEVNGPLGWAGRTGQYIAGIYFIIGLTRLNRESQSGSLSDRWIATFTSDRTQITTFFSKIAEGFAYCRIVTDSNGKPVDWVFLDINEAYEKLNNIEKSKVLGKKASEVLPILQRDPAEWVKLYAKVALDGESLIFDRLMPMGKWYHISVYSPQKGYFISIFEDISQRKKAEQEVARLASFPILSPQPIVEINSVNKITFANPATSSVFPDLLTLGLDHAFFSNWPIVKHTFEDPNISTFGREVKISNHWYHQQLYRVPNTQQIRIYSTDIDELKQAEESRAKAQTKLEENAVMLEEYASQLEELAEQRAQQLQNAERLVAIGQTAGMVGHDIRNPLQAITGDMYIIAEEVKDMPDGDSKQAIVESLESVNQNLSYINKIVSDLQDYTRPLKPNLQDANLAELIEGTLLTITVPKGIEVITTVDAKAKPIHTDVAYMRRILTNLMTNAVQAMQDEGKLIVEAHKKKNVTVLTVEDTGVGIPDEVKEKMFTPLFTTKSKGQGLGLAVVKRLVDALGGSIAFESTAGKGTKFVVELPQKT